MNKIEMICDNYNTCGSSIFATAEEFDLYEGVYICDECYDSEEMFLNNDYSDDAWALASAGHGSDEDYF